MKMSAKCSGRVLLYISIEICFLIDQGAEYEMSGQVEVKYWRAPSNVQNDVGQTRRVKQPLLQRALTWCRSSGAKQGLHSLLLNHSSRFEKIN